MRCLLQPAIPLAAILLAACAGSVDGDGSGDARDAGGGGEADADPLEPDLERDATVRVDLERERATIAPDLVGLSLEYDLVGPYLGRTTDQLNGVFLQLLTNLGRGTLRVGGSTTDTGCWRTSAGATLPESCGLEITASSLRVIAATMGEVDWRALLGVNLNRYSPATALDFARDGVVPAFGGDLSRLVGLQFGNEPNQYVVQGRRPTGYDHPDFVEEWNAYADAIAGEASTAALPAVGPAYGTRNSWSALVSDFIKGTGSKLGGVVALHDYPLSNCGDVAPGIDRLLDEEAVASSVERVASVAEIVGPLGTELQVDQSGSISCNGVDGVTNTFASALWTVDYVLSLARAGARRVNFHTRRGSYYDAIVAESQGPTDGVYTYSTRVLPMYYAMVLVARASGGRLLDVETDASFALKAHAVRAADGSTLVYLVNKDMSGGGAVAVTPSAARGAATAIRLEAPALDARADAVTLGGQQVDGSTGMIAAPASESVEPATARGTYLVDVPHSSAVLLVIPAE